VQSSSPDNLEAECFKVTNSWQGTPKNTKLFGCVVADSTMKIGPHSFGAAESFSSEASQFAGFDIGGQTESDILGAGAYQFVGGGVIKRVKAAGTGEPPTWMSPNGLCFLYATNYNTLFPFQIKDVREDGTNLFIDTTLAGFPVLSGPSTYNVRSHPAPSFTVIDCQGCADALDFSGGPSAAVNMRNYSARTLSSWSSQQPSIAQGWGRLVSLTVNVITPYTGTRPTLNLEIGDQLGANIVDAAGNTTRIDPTVDVKTPGKRVITPTSITGAKPNDNLGLPPGIIWWASEIAPYLSNNISGESSSVWPVVSYELILDQGAQQQTIAVIVVGPQAYPADTLIEIMIDAT
jgi:hypothetical protein